MLLEMILCPMAKIHTGSAVDSVQMILAETLQKNILGAGVASDLSGCSWETVQKRLGHTLGTSKSPNTSELFRIARKTSTKGLSFDIKGESNSHRSAVVSHPHS